MTGDDKARLRALAEAGELTAEVRREYLRVITAEQVETITDPTSQVEIMRAIVERVSRARNRIA